MERQATDKNKQKRSARKTRVARRFVVGFSLHSPNLTHAMRASPVRASATAPAAAGVATPFRPAKATLFLVPLSNKAAQVSDCERMLGRGAVPQRTPNMLLAVFVCVDVWGMRGRAGRVCLSLTHGHRDVS